MIKSLTSIKFQSFYLTNYRLFVIKMASIEQKRLKVDKNNKKIGTHNGMFHCDEILACYMLKSLPEYSNAEIIRTRDNSDLESCDIVVDVGSIYKPSTFRFDHHQATFIDTFSTLRPEFGSKYNVRLSSAGLIYVHYGEEVIREILKSYKNYVISDEELKIIYIKVYENLIREIDGMDNGVPMFEGEPNYTINTHLSSRIGDLNPSWNENLNEDEIFTRFKKGVNLVGEVLRDKVFYYTLSWLPARSIVEDAIKNRFDVHKSGEILEIKQFAPWKQHLSELEVEFNIVGVPKYVIYPDKANWRVICVPNEPSSFVCRKFLHKMWRGVRDEQLANISGISDAQFCHANGFIGGSKTRDGALEMAVKSLESDEI